MAHKEKIIELANALEAYRAICPQEARLTHVPSLIEEIEALSKVHSDRYSILFAMLEKRGHTSHFAQARQIEAILLKRHADAEKRKNDLGERSEENASAFDQLSGEELALHNAIMAISDDLGSPIHSAAERAGLTEDEANALLQVGARGRIRYEEEDELANGYQGLIDNGLGMNISSHFSGRTRGICLTSAGDIAYGLLTGASTITSRTRAAANN